MTALFVAVFLFFLSVALVWTNRQDIALSLSMEHKMKAEVAARSGANYVYGALRATGSPPPSLEETLESGAQWKVQLLRLPPEGRRGRVLLVQSRGQSGPVSSHVTFHLLESELASDSAEAKNRLLIFPSIVMASGSEDVDDPSVTLPKPGQGGRSGSAPPVKRPEPKKDTTQEPEKPQKTPVLPPNFVTEMAELRLPSSGSLAAQEGPVFASEQVTSEVDTPALSVVDHIPVFSSVGGTPQAFGPALINLVASSDRTELRTLKKIGEKYEWEAIPAPLELAEGSSSTSTSSPPVGRVDISASGAEWRGLTIRSIDGMGKATSWTEPESLNGTVLNSFPAEGTQDWSGSSRLTRTVSLRGAITAYKNVVYSHAWQYLYLRYSGGSTTPPYTAQTGSRILRWPCIVKFDIDDKRWSFAWNPLKDNGDITSPLVPKPENLWVSGSKLYALNSSNSNELFELNSNGSATRKGIVNGGRAVVYQEKIYTPSSDTARPGLVAIDGGAAIDFKTLPERIPMIAGPVIPPPPSQILGYDLSKVEVSELGESQPTQVRTVVPLLNITYSISSSSGMASAGQDLYLNIVPAVETVKSESEVIGQFNLGAASTPVFARYDGSRWHILPNGVMAALQNPSLSSPGSQILCASYDGLRQPCNRYSVISISTDPFEFKL